MITKTIKYQIVKPLDCNWDLLGRVLRDINYETRKILNQTIQLCWEYSNFSSDYKDKHGVYPNNQEVLKYKGIDGYIYNILKDKYKRLNTGNLSQTLKSGYDRWKADQKDIFLGKKSIPCFKKDCPIDLANKSINIYKEDNNYIAKLSLLSRAYKNELGVKSGQIKVVLKANDNSQKAILNRIISGQYKLCASQIINTKNKWFLHISFKFEPEEKKLDHNRILGIDLGVVNVATLQVFDKVTNKYDWLKYNQCVLEGSELIAFRQRIEKRREGLKKQAKVAGDGRVGHGRHTRMKPLNKISDKIAKFRDTYNHKISRYIVDFALKHNCGIIQMEDLTGFSQKAKEAFLKNWSYCDLQEKIKYKAEENCIEVVLVNPQYTSKRCNKCGHIHEENRICKTNQSKFKCMSCGYESNADINAARNIAIPDIDKIIDAYIKQQNKKEGKISA